MSISCFNSMNAFLYDGCRWRNILQTKMASSEFNRSLDNVLEQNFGEDFAALSNVDEIITKYSRKLDQLATAVSVNLSCMKLPANQPDFRCLNSQFETSLD